LTFISFIARGVGKEKSARELRQSGSEYRCCIPALAGFVSPQSIAPDGAGTITEKIEHPRWNFDALTHNLSSARIARVKPLLIVLFALICVSCTTLENRRDLYRSPGEFYEEWSPHPPPTRLPNSGPAARPGTPADPNAPQQTHGVITFPEEPGLPPAEER
jgi:hypothetical protein